MRPTISGPTPGVSAHSHPSDVLLTLEVHFLHKSNRFVSNNQATMYQNKPLTDSSNINEANQSNLELRTEQGKPVYWTVTYVTLSLLFKQYKLKVFSLIKI